LYMRCLLCLGKCFLDLIVVPVNIG